ncbi:Glucosaminyl phosphatidylinositol (GlcN-PI) nositol acylation protein, partial [Cladochytrium tenue]
SAYAAWRALAPHLPGPRGSAVSLAQHMMAEFVVLVVPQLLAMTVAADAAAGIASGSLAVFAVCLALPVRSSGATGAPPAEEEKDGKGSKAAVQFRPFSVALRASLQLLTATAILAVDFRAFPRKFAKTESYGASLMDLGVGAIVFSNGFVAGPRLRRSVGSVADVLKALRVAAPVLLIGAARTLATKGVNYQEHATEYGVHWNFFFTLGLIPVFTAVVKLAVPRLNIALVGFLLILGYLSIFFVAAHVGDKLLSEDRDAASHVDGDDTGDGGDWVALGVQRVVELLSMLMLAAGLFGLVHFRLDVKLSRRLVNISYALFVVSVMLAFLALAAAADLAVALRHGGIACERRPGAVPVLFQSISQNQLATFLVANLLTGAVNLTLDTLSASDTAATAVLLLYLAVVTGFAVACRHTRLSL